MRLFNCVHHIYNRINIAKKQYEQVIIGAGVQDKIADVFDEVMDHKADEVLPNMQDCVFDDEYNNDEAMIMNLRYIMSFRLFQPNHVCWT